MDSEEQEIRYLNTDLDLVADFSLEELSAKIEERSCYALHTTLGDDGKWHASFEANDCSGDWQSLFAEHLATLLSALESLDEDSKSLLSRCQKFDFCIGFDSGDTPRYKLYPISAQHLARIAALGATISICVYQVPKIVKQESSSD